MTAFGIRFLFCNLFVSLIVLLILLVKKLLGKHLSGRSQYHLWFLLPVILAAPFLPVRPAGPARLVSWLRLWKSADLPAAARTVTAAGPDPAAGWIHDFGVSVTKAAAPAADQLLILLWISGMLAAAVFLLRSRIRLYRLEQSALPLQNPQVRELYRKCSAELRIRREIPIFSTAFLKSPIIAGCLRPRIYMPIRLISEFHADDLRYMLLHELQHYKHKDAWVNLMANTAAVVYWFNPVIWYALKEIRSDQEIACDTSVLRLLNAGEKLDYGNTLLNFARAISHSPFLLASGIGSSAGQLRKRILNIARYRPCTGWRRIRERVLVIVLAVLILESTAFIPVSAADTRVPLPENAAVLEEDLSAFFSGNEGCFVLYDSGADTWHIYNKSLAAQRVSPDSTYKIYSALYALENGSITPDASERKWDGQPQLYPQWNQDQTLSTAMKDSVNWYFQGLDRQAGPENLKNFYREIDYGNHDLSGGINEFWAESSLKISALEQVQLLRNFYANTFGFNGRNIQAVKDALILSSSGQAVLSGKTGTGIVNGQTVSSWLIGYVEADNNTFFFAANVRNPSDAEELTASRIALQILEAEGICQKPDAALGG